jgi:hypothetical protein
MIRELFWQRVDEDGRQRIPGVLPLWFGILAGPAAWMIHLNGGYFLASARCDHGAGFQQPLNHALTIAMLGLTFAGGAVAYWAWRKLGGGYESRGEPPLARARFMALSGIIITGTAIILILFGYGATLAAGCERSH